MTVRNLFTLLIISIIVIVIAVLLYKKYNKPNDSSQDDGDNSDSKPSDMLSDIEMKANEEKEQQKGSVGNWGDNQKKFIYYSIAFSLLDTQTEITGKEMSIDDFSMEITDCLTCIVKNFSAKYTYTDVVDKMETPNKDTTFDDFFKNLYTTCECEDKLGELLIRLLKEFWLEESGKTCPETKDRMSDCIRTISYTGFDDVNRDEIYDQLSYCITNFCPDLLNA